MSALHATARDGCDRAANDCVGGRTGSPAPVRHVCAKRARGTDLPASQLIGLLMAEPDASRSGPALDATAERAVETIRRDGYVVLENRMSPQLLGAVRSGLDPWLRGELMGRNDFEGFRTERVYALLEKAPVIADMIEDELVLAITDRLLPVDYLLSSALAINVHPGETPQRFHLDDSGNAFPIPLPRHMLGVSTIWALDDFTATNGATEIVPRSHLWSEARAPESITDDEATKGEMNVAPAFAASNA